MSRLFISAFFSPPVALWADDHGVQISSLSLSTAKRFAAHLLQSHRHHQGIRERHSRGREPGWRDAQEDHWGILIAVNVERSCSKLSVLFPRTVSCLCSTSLQVYSSLSEGEFQLLRQTLLIFFQDMHVRVSSLIPPNQWNENTAACFSNYHFFCIPFSLGVTFPQKSSAESQWAFCPVNVRPSASWDRCSRAY